MGCLMILFKLFFLSMAFLLWQWLSVPPLSNWAIDIVVIIYLLSLIGVSLSFSIKLWKWYDSILDRFSISFRILDMLTWLVLLAFLLNRYQELYANLEKALSNPVSHGIFGYSKMALYVNIYSWGGLTTIGFITIGILRFVSKKGLFKD